MPTKPPSLTPKKVLALQEERDPDCTHLRLWGLVSPGEKPRVGSEE